MSNEIAIKVEWVSKSFRLPHNKQSSLKGALINLLGRGDRTFEIQEVLNNVSFEINKGEFFGIVGRNGSGKSTLLKMLSGIYAPTKGNITINGSLTPFIELGVGFNPELTGRENVYLNGALLGFNNKEMGQMYDDIVAFAELERFMDQKLKNYSSGMQVRLAFSIAIRANSDILVLDEVLAVGDEAFQRKCFEYFAKLKSQKKTVVLVTHDMQAVQRFCNRAILIDKGKIVHSGNVAKVAQHYQLLNREHTTSKPREKPSNHLSHKKGIGEIRTVLYNSNNQKTRVLTGDDTVFKITNEIRVRDDVGGVFFGFTIRKDNGELVYWYTTELEAIFPQIITKGNTITLSHEIDNIFGEGVYSISTSLKSLDRTKEYIIEDDVLEFNIISRGPNGWMLHPNVKVNIE